MCRSLRRRAIGNGSQLPGHSRRPRLREAWEAWRAANSGPAATHPLEPAPTRDTWLLLPQTAQQPPPLPPNPIILCLVEMGRALNKAGSCTCKSSAIRTGFGVKRLRAIRNVKRWKDAPKEQWAAHYNTTLKPFEDAIKNSLSDKAALDEGRRNKLRPGKGASVTDKVVPIGRGRRVKDPTGSAGL